MAQITQDLLPEQDQIGLNVVIISSRQAQRCLVRSFNIEI